MARPLAAPLLDPLPALLATSFVGALGMGVSLRAQLAGLPVPGPGAGALRSAHEHLAWYGLVLPLAWVGLERAGLARPGPATAWAYAAAVALSTAGFLHSGYNAVSITGSTVVLAVWLAWAAPGLRHLLRRDWRAVAAVAVIASAVAIPAVAVLSRRGDPAASSVVRSFLSWLLLGVAAPAALARAGARAPIGALGAALMLAAGLSLGFGGGPLGRLGLAGCGLMLGSAGVTAPLSRTERAAWALVGLGLALTAAGLIPEQYPIPLANLHVTALGPVLVGLAWPQELGAWRGLYLCVVALFGLAIAGPALLPWAGWAALSFTLGAGVALSWALVGLRQARVRRGALLSMQA